MNQNDILIEFYTELSKHMAMNPSIRHGQSVFNTMHALRPNIANSLRGGQLDPFNDDKKVYKFMEECFFILSNEVN